MTEYVYGTWRLDTAGRTFRNARFFEKPEPDATHVVVAGDHPNIVQAYEAAGVRVSILERGHLIPRRVGPGPIPPSVADKVTVMAERPKTVVNLTKRELCADLEALRVDFDPRDRKADLLALRDAARAERAAGIKADDSQAGA